MKSVTSLFLLVIILSLTLNGCGPGSSPTATPVIPTPTSVSSTLTPTTLTSVPATPVLPALTPTSVSPTLTPITPTPVPSTPTPQGRTIVVTSTADSGPGTLRQALRVAQSGDTITFDTTVFPPAAPATIFLKAEDDDSALPNIDQGGLVIDASHTGVILDGSDIQGDGVNGLEIYSDGNTVWGLQIVNFTGSGIALCDGSHNTIGGDRSIGTGPLGQGNLTSKNGIGIDLCATGSYNTVAGNIVGTDPTDTNDWGNNMDGILVEKGMTHNTIGPDNIIAHNCWNGIQITGLDAFGNVITQNSIHDNDQAGIRLWDGGNTMLDPPQILGFDMAMGSVTGTACAHCIIDIFSDSGNEGQVYEGQTKANNTGAFTFNKGVSFIGFHLTATATDADGNTSEFSLPTYASLQKGNNFPRIRLQPKQSRELEDNRIGAFLPTLWVLEPAFFPDFVLDASSVFELGVKRVRLAINNLDWDKVDWSKPEFFIDPSHDALITSLADNGVTLTYVLTFWDKAYKAGGREISIPRFKAEEEIQRYLDFVRFIVRHFKNRIEYYEIWNEPSGDYSIQRIEVEDYINLVERAVPIIRQEFPEARIVVGGTHYLIQSDAQDYLFSVLRSDIMPLVDVVSWHPMYGTSPEDYYHNEKSIRQYYYEYPSIVQEIKDEASVHGFEGEYVADELSWTPPEYLPPDYTWLPTYSETKCAKYYARGIVMHLGMGVTVSQFYYSDRQVSIKRTIQNLSTVMAGAVSVSLPIEIQSEATNIRSCSFSLSNGDHVIALWTDGVAVDEDPGIQATLIFPGFSVQRVMGIDVLNGFKQQMITKIEDGHLVIRNLSVKDYPIILRFSDITSP